MLSFTLAALLVAAFGWGLYRLFVADLRPQVGERVTMVRTLTGNDTVTVRDGTLGTVEHTHRSTLTVQFDNGVRADVRPGWVDRHSEDTEGK